jgi:ABC-type uncharacterized transport system involved in gliding motility auxiliary subunit
MPENHRYQSILTALLLLVLAGLLGWLSARYPWEMDWTRGGRHELSTASRQVLDRMPGPIEVTSYARADPGLRELVRAFVFRYQRYKRDISLEFINPDTAPDEVRNLGIVVDGELVLRYRGRVEHVLNDSEQAFTNALQRLRRGAELWLAFIEGHGERSPLGDADHDLSRWARQLQNRGLNLQPVNLAVLPAIPDNTAVLVIASPRSDYLPSEIRMIRDFLDRGGSLLWLVEPGAQDGLRELAAYLGVAFPAGSIIDMMGQVNGVNDPRVALVTRQLYAPHPAFDQFDLTTHFPLAAAVNIDRDSPWQASPVITTASHTWLERGELHGEIGFDPGQDQQGPFHLAVSLERILPDAPGGRRQRAMIIGDGDFLANNYIDNHGNLDLGLRLMDWLTRSDDFIAIPARTVEDADLQLSRPASIILGFGLLLLLPAGLLTAGALIWWRRRRL